MAILTRKAVSLQTIIKQWRANKRGAPTKRDLPADLKLFVTGWRAAEAWHFKRLRPRRRKVPARIVAAIRASVRCGISRKVIAERYGLHISTISRYVGGSRRKKKCRTSTTTSAPGSTPARGGQPSARSLAASSEA